MAGASAVPTALILGHSFVKRLDRNLRAGFDPQANRDFRLQGTVSVRLQGFGGRTVQCGGRAIHVVKDLAPDIILEIGTNDLSHSPPELIGSAIEDLGCLLLNHYFVCVIGVCHVTPRGISFPRAMVFLQQATILNQYVSVVLENFPNAFCWSHEDFNSPFKDLYWLDGVHVHPTVQYLHYRSSRLRSCLGRIDPCSFLLSCPYCNFEVTLIVLV